MNKKVYILTILVFVMAINAVFSQTTTKKLSYQAVVRNAANELVVNQNLSVEITILNANNVPQYKETHATVPTNQNGLLWLWVGDGTPTLGTMDNVVWKDATIKSVFTLPDGSTVEQNTPVTAMPYAYFADEVDTIFLQDYLTTHNYGNDDYVTHQELNDTLNHYYTNEQVDAALIPYATNAHLNDTLSHYLMKEVQVLSISHDTIFLTGGSFVVLPKGFSGSYHDLVDTPTNVSAFTNDAGYLTEHQSLEGYVTQDALHDTLSYYTTTGSIDTLLGAYFDSTQVKTAIHDTAEAIRAAIPASQVNADWNATGGPAEILNKPDLSVYATKDELNDYEKKSDLCGDVKECIDDTLKHYTTSDKIDTLLGAYFDSTQVKTAIHDTASALRALMGDAANDGLLMIVAAGDTTRFTANQATNDTVRLNQFATKDTLANFATTEDLANYEPREELCGDVKNCIKDTLGKYTTTDQIDTLLDNYLTIEGLCDSIEKNCTNVALKNKNNIFTGNNTFSGTSTFNDKARFNEQVTFDSTTFFNNIANFDSTVYIDGHTYISKEVEVDADVLFKKYNYYFSVNNFYEHDAIVLINEAVSQITLAPTAVTPDNNLNRKQAVNYNDLMVVYDTLKKTVQNDNAALAARIVADSNRLVEFKGKVHNDSIALAKQISDSTRMVFDTLHTYYATKDTLKNFLTINGLCDSVVKCVVIKEMRDSIQDNTAAIQVNATNIGTNKQAIIDSSAHIRNEIKNGQITIAVNRSTTTTETTVTNPTFGVNQGTDQTVTINIPQETTVNNGQLTIVAAGDTTRFTANQATNDTVRLDKFATKDTLSKYTTTDNIDTIVNKHHFLTSDSALIVRMRDSIQKVNAHVSADSLVLATKLHTDSVDLAKHISDSTRMVFDTLHKYYATKDTLKNFVNKLAIRDSVNKIVKDSLRIGTSAINIAIDTIARHNISDSTRMVFDTLHKYYATKEALKDTAKNLRGIICDSATACITKALADPTSEINYAIDTIARHHVSDSTRMVFDTLHKYYATKDTLKNFVNKLAIRDSVNKIVTDSLRKGPSEMTRAIDSIARHHISDSTRMVFDTLHLYYTTLQTLKDTASNIRSAFPTVNNGTLTIQKNGTSVGSFTANQATPENINIDVPTKLSQMINDGGVYAKRDSINVFTAENNFTSTVTVPSNTTTIPRPTTAEHPCTDNTANAVNICDLLAVFDSLNSRIKKLEDKLDAMQSAMIPTTITSNVVNASTTTSSIEVHATATNPAFQVLSYEFCCTDCGDGVTPVCTTITSNSYTFENLNSYTDYHFTVKAHTFVDTVESSPVQAKTKAEAPTATYVVTALPVPLAGFTVNLSEIDLKGVANGTVKVAYKKSTASSYGNESTENINASSSIYSKTVANLEGNTSYDVRIIVGNGDASTTYTATVTTGDAVTLSLTRVMPSGTNIKRCKPGSTNNFVNYVVLKATLSSGSVSDYSWVWTLPSINNGSASIVSQTDSTCTIQFNYNTIGSKAQTYSVTCTATYLDDNNIQLTNNISVKFAKNNNSNYTDADFFPDFSINVTDHTVTLYSPSASDLFTDWVSWYEGAVPESVGSSPSYTYDSYGTYTISAYSEHGCLTTADVTVAPSLGITNDHEPGNIGLCGESAVQVTYTAVPEEGEITDYTYSWSVSSGATIESQTDNTCVVNYTSAGDYTITCNATHTASNTPIQKITNTTINSGSKPTLVLCQEGNSLQLLSFGDATYIDWGYDFPNQSSTPQTNEVTPNYPQGSYTVTIRNNAGCSSSKEVYFGVVHSFIPCVLSEIDPSGTHPAQETAATGVDANHNNDGLESVENGAITSITDYDGNVYSVVQIGSQCWLAENMRCTHSPSTGTLIVNPQGLSGNNAKGSCSFKTAHWYNNNPSQYGAYGLYYDWCAAVDTYYVAGGYNETDWGVNTSFHSKAWSCVFTETHRRGICPKGWHIPTDDEWNVMEAEVDGASATYTNTGYRGSHAGKLARDWCRWKSSDVTNAPGNKSANRNSSYFGAMNAGRYTNSAFVGSDDWISNAYFWSASSYNNDNAWSRRLTYNYPGVYRESGGREKTNGLSVRCLRDYEVGSSNFTPSATTDEASNLGPHTATLNGSIANANIYTISSKGFEYKASTTSDYTQVLAGGNEFTYNLIGLAANTTYQYRAFAVYAGGTVYGEEVSFTTPEPVTVLSITPDISSPVSICKNGSTLGSKAVTYTAAVTYDEAPVNGYRYSWSVPSGLQYNTNGNTCTVVYKATGTTYAVTCTATPDNNVGDPFVETSQTVLTTTDVSSLPSFTSCENDYGRSVEIKTSTNVDSYTWGGNTLSSSNSGCTYANDGVYVITANDNSNCTTTKMVAIGLATTSPCTVTSHHTNDAEYTPTTGGLETENNEGKVLTVQDQDGHSYAVVQIGNQCWMRSNLRTTTYSDGTTIPNGTLASGANTLSATDPYRYKPASTSSFNNYEFQNYNEVTDGLYYNWAAAMNGAASSTANPSGVQGVCPKGWHLPSDAEWGQMRTWVYNNRPVTNPGDQTAFFFCGGCQWNSVLSTITYKPADFAKPDRNYSGFTALPVGYVGDDGKFKFYHITDNSSDNSSLQYSWFWSSCEKSGDTNEADNWWLYAGGTRLQQDDEKKLCGASVRCVRD